MTYQRFLRPGFKPFDPLELARITEQIVTRKGPEGLERKYTGIYSAPVYRGVATGYAVGCCLRCMYCWTNWSRDFPELYGKFYSPRAVAESLFQAAEKGITAPQWEKFKHFKITKLRLSGCEPTIGKEHLLAVLEYVMDSKYPLFILETNGILLGADRNYVKQLSAFRNKLYVRVSIKAATPEGFTQRTGAIGSFYELPFRALEYLLDEGIFARPAAMTDPRVMPQTERTLLLKRLGKIDKQFEIDLEEEVIDNYDTTIKRIRAYVDKDYAEKLEHQILHRRGTF